MLRLATRHFTLSAALPKIKRKIIQNKFHSDLSGYLTSTFWCVSFAGTYFFQRVFVILKLGTNIPNLIQVLECAILHSDSRFV